MVANVLAVTLFASGDGNTLDKCSDGDGGSDTLDTCSDGDCDTLDKCSDGDGEQPMVMRSIPE
eukprot:9437858-Alexandrium_andersonii.AAC.1